MASFRLMGIINVTPDSFSDGGRFLAPAAALEHGRALAGEGAEILDVGGESTRPGAEPVSTAEELRRTVPVLEELAAAGLGVRLSIDTVKAPVAAAAIEAGASIVNDVSALRADPEMAGLVAASGVECCLMHMLGEPRTMQREPRYGGDVVDEVKAFLQERLEFAVAAGIAEERIVLDPGIGFGKTLAHNLALLGRLRRALRPRAPDPDRHLTQELPGAARGPCPWARGAARGRSQAARDARHLRARARAGGHASSASTRSPRSPRR